MSYFFPSQTITLEAALRDLASGSPKSRAMAAHALGDVTDPVEKRRAVDALVRALDDDRADVRMEACAALGELRDVAAVPALIKRLDDGAEPVRQHAAIALGTLRHPDGFEPLATALREGPADLRFQAATSIAEIDPIRAFDIVLAALADRDVQVVSAAALSLGAIGSSDDARRARAVAALANRLDHANPSTRFDVAYALAELGDGSGREVLSAMLGDVDRAWDAVSALAELRAADELARALESKQTPPEARVLAAGKLCELRGDAAARAVLLDALTSRKGHVRALAVEQLGDVGGPWAKAPLEKLARSAKGSDFLEAIAAALRQIEARA